jgi:membrane protein YqaA with SNARE-associated domain
MDSSSMSSLSSMSFATTPDAKLAPIVVAGAAYVGKAVAGGVIGGATSWAVNRVLDNRFPERKR